MNNIIISTLQACLFIALAPLLMGFVKWCKCHLQNRQAPSLFQPYRNLHKLFHKEPLVADTASYIFRIAPYFIFAITVLIGAIVPLIVVDVSGATIALADVIVLVGLFALARFFLVLAGMDIGTAFGGMGSSREMMIAAIAEPALLMALFNLAMISASTNLSAIISYFALQQSFLHPAIIFAAVGFALVALAETGRIPIDNPATHLELTMVHEAMILEYSGRHLALIEWAAQIKFMIYAVMFVNLFIPWGIAYSVNLGGAALLLSGVVLIFKLIILIIVLTIAETNLAKLRLFRVPYLLNLAFLMCLLGILSYVIFG
jgi:formate hydrogenlyase subunit 4